MEVVETLILGHGNEDEKMSVVMCVICYMMGVNYDRAGI